MYLLKVSGFFFLFLGSEGCLYEGKGEPERGEAKGEQFENWMIYGDGLRRYVISYLQKT